MTDFYDGNIRAIMSLQDLMCHMWRWIMYCKIGCLFGYLSAKNIYKYVIFENIFMPCHIRCYVKPMFILMCLNEI